MFGRLLIANRGEIACRVIRTARRMGVHSIAVYSEADAQALHVRLADEAWLLGAATPAESYLSIGRLIDVARRAGAEAVHPGYGFLAESPAFAAACVEAGLVFVGPSAAAMRVLGGKAAAKALARRLGVPTLPFSPGDSQELSAFMQAAEAVGYPVVAKATAGGGGRGMRVVRNAPELPAAIESARREALLAFGDDRLLVEKYLERPRHVETQIFADRFGSVVTFPERDCSLQRHHQKLIEETPAPGLSERLRGAIMRDATTLVGAVDYQGAGTVEFLVQDDRHYFLEANTRLQVEHPVTEMVCGVDLVEWQLRVAAGESLPLRQDELRPRGWAIEARLCAEDPAEGFRPAVGVIERLSLPHDVARIETGVQAGDTVSAHYDSLLAKLVVWDQDRAGALRKLQRGLDAVELVGVATNLDFLRAAAHDERFLHGAVDTRLIETVPKSRAAPSDGELVFVLAAAAAAFLETTRTRAADGSPWAVRDGWRLYGEAATSLTFRSGQETHLCRISRVRTDAFRLEFNDRRHEVSTLRESERIIVGVDGVTRPLAVVRMGARYVVILDGRNHSLDWIDPLAPPVEADDEEKSFMAPLPARVLRIFVKDGERVARGAPVLVLEAMKMEIPMSAPSDGTIGRILCSEGQSVREGDMLVAMAEG